MFKKSRILPFIILAFLVLGVFLYRYPISSKLIEGVVKKELEKKGIIVELDRLYLYVFPFRLEGGGKFFWDGNYLKAERISLVPKVFSLLKGKVVIKRMECERFEISEKLRQTGKLPLLYPEQALLKDGKVSLKINKASIEVRIIEGFFKKRGPQVLFFDLQGLKPQGRIKLKLERVKDKYLLSLEANGIRVREIKEIWEGISPQSPIPKFLEGGEFQEIFLQYGPFDKGEPFDSSKLRLKGLFKEGGALLPSNMAFKGIEGELDLKGDLLSLRAEKAHLEEAIFKRVLFKLPLKGGGFYLQTEIETPPWVLLKYLPLFLPQKDLKAFFDQYEEPQGEIRGSLKVEDSKIEALIDRFELKLRHKGFRFPFFLQGNGEVKDERLKLKVQGESEGIKFQEGTFSVSFKDGRGEASLKEGLLEVGLFKDFLPFKDLGGEIRFKTLKALFSLAPFKLYEYSLKGEPHLKVTLPKIGPLLIEKGLLEVNPRELGFYENEIGSEGIQGKVSGLLRLEEGKVKRGVLEGKIELKEGGKELISSLLDLQTLSLSFPDSFKGKAQFEENSFQIQGSLDFIKGIKADLLAKKEGERVVLEKLELISPERKALLRGDFDPWPSLKRISFKGELEKELEILAGIKGGIKGDFRLDLGHKTFNGWVELKDVFLSELLDFPLKIHRVNLKGKDEGFLELYGDGEFEGQSFQGGGKLGLLEDQVQLDLKLKGKSLDLTKLDDLLKGEGEANVRGSISVELEEALYNGLSLKGVEAEVKLLGDGAWRVSLNKGGLCGIQLEGFYQEEKGKKDFEFQLRSTESSFKGVFSCLGVKQFLLDGDFLLEGIIKAQGSKEPLWEDSEGSIYLYSSKGRIYKLTLLSKLFALLNLTEILRGKMPDLLGKGFFYDKLEAFGKIKNGVLELEEFIIEGPSLKLFGKGEIELRSGEMDLLVIAAPLRTIDVLLSKIPLLGYLITGKKGLLAFPFSVKGHYQDPKFIPLPPQLLGGGILAFVERLFQLPLKVVEPLTVKSQQNANR